MPIRLSGMISGLDTDAIVKELVSAYSLKKENIVKSQTKLSWKQDAWKEMNTKIYSLYSKTLSNMRLESTYNAKKASVSDDGAARVTAANNAVLGTQTLKVNSVASTGYMTGGKLSTDNSVDANTMMQELGITGAKQLRLTVGGEAHIVKIDSSTTVSSLVSSLKETGINVSFDQENQRLFLNSSKPGAEGDFEFTVDADSYDMLDKLGLLKSYQKTEGAKITAQNGAAATEATKLSDIYPDLLTEDNSSTSLKIKVGTKEATIQVTKDTTVEDMMTKIAEASDDKTGQGLGISAQFDETTGKIIMEGTEFSIEATGTDAEKEIGNKVLQGFGLQNKDGAADEDKIKTTVQSGSAVKIDGADAEIELNGATYTSTTGNFNINGLSIEAIEPTDKAVNISVTTDSDAIYKKIKDFLTEYNTLINSMSSSYNAATAKGYEPLTDEEKDAMSEKEVETWEAKIKDASLRRDQTLSSLMSSMVISMSQTYQVDGQNYSLSSFGINTLSYFVSADNEKNAYHIDGDEEDTNTSGNKDKLRAAIGTDPEKVTQFFSQLAKGLYTTLDEKMKRTTLSSAYTAYNDKELSSQYDEYDDQIDEWDKRISDMEDSWYSKFTAMETALSKLESQQSSLASLFG